MVSVYASISRCSYLAILLSESGRRRNKVLAHFNLMANETWKFVQAKSKQAMKQVLGIRDEKARMKVTGGPAPACSSGSS